MNEENSYFESLEIRHKGRLMKTTPVLYRDSEKNKLTTDVDGMISAKMLYLLYDGKYVLIKKVRKSQTKPVQLVFILDNTEGTILPTKYWDDKLYFFQK